MPAAAPGLAPARLFDRLTAAAPAEWRRYTRHAFVLGLASGTLPADCFRHYLVQDYLFLIHFARAYALAAYKSESLRDMREAAATLTALIDQEMGLHLSYCREWGLDPDALEKVPEATATLAYTRFVLERGMAGDLLDLHVALAPCVVGYAEIAALITGEIGTDLAGNPYASWIETYRGADYAAVADGARDRLDRLYAERGGENRFPALAETFRRATALEAAFWDMGMNVTA